MPDPLPLCPCDRALLRAQPLLPPVRITGVTATPFGLRYHWHHEAPGFGQSPQSSKDPAELIPVPEGYVPPPTGWPAPGFYSAGVRWLDENRLWLAEAFGAERILVVRATLAKRLSPDPVRAAVLRERDRIIARRVRSHGRRHAA